MSTESKDFDHYAIVLADLKAKRDQLDQAIRAIESVRSGVSPAASQPPPQPAHDAPLGAGAFHGMSISEATKKLLAIRKRTMNNSEVLAELKSGGMVLTSADPLNTVGAVLTRRSKESGDIVKVGRGTWGLKEWYRNSKLGKVQPKENGDSETKISPSEPEQPLEPDPDDFEDLA